MKSSCQCLYISFLYSERERGSINYSNSITESHRVRKRDNVSLIAYFFENFVFSVTLLRWHW